MHKFPLVAIDTNFPLLLAEENPEALDALATVRERVRPGKILILPTVLEELRYHAKQSSDQELRELASSALLNLERRWRFEAEVLDSTKEAIVAEAARRLLFSGLLPPEERNDATIIAESAVLNSILLVSNDSHLLDLDHRRLGLLFRELNLPVPLIVSPREIVRKFYR